MVRNSPSPTTQDDRGPTNDSKARTIAVFIAWIIGIVVVFFALNSLFSLVSGSDDDTVEQIPQNSTSQTATTEPSTSEDTEAPPAIVDKDRDGYHDETDVAIVDENKDGIEDDPQSDSDSDGDSAETEQSTTPGTGGQSTAVSGTGGQGAEESGTAGSGPGAQGAGSQNS